MRTSTSRSRSRTLLLPLLFSLAWLAQLNLASQPQSVLSVDSLAVAGSPSTQLITDEIISAARDAHAQKTCASCRALLVPFKRLAHLGDASFVNAVVQLCKVRKLADPDICEGDVGSQGPIIAHGLRQISTSGRTATLLCNALFGLCDLVPAEPYNMTFPELTQEDREDVETTRNDSKARITVAPGLERTERRKPFQVVHLSDVHIDRHYTVRRLFIVFNHEIRPRTLYSSHPFCSH